MKRLFIAMRSSILLRMYRSVHVFCVKRISNGSADVLMCDFQMMRRFQLPFDHPFMFFELCPNCVCSEMTQIITDLSEDPTMPRTNDVVCGNCGNREAIFFQQQVTDENESQSMHFLCTHCRHHWKDG
eukprot:TRINITY_DN2970_c0_g1_i3.p2 TRINITY_DN2970_c0_g1~~TRINITY_DN2970_c0_g1_i3.p2  ORF type:complete len:128 (-),score=11.69 TRINITY_DN2970_c0_g1_i3:638-1021(-)